MTIQKSNFFLSIAVLVSCSSILAFAQETPKEVPKEAPKEVVAAPPAESFEPQEPTPADLVASSPPPVFYDTQDAVEAAPERPLKSLSADTDPASRIVVVKKDAAGKSPEARFAAAGRAMKLGRYNAALKMYDDLYAKDKKNPNILIARAVALHRLGRFDEAIAAYEKLLEVRPNSVEAEVNMLGLMSDRYPASALQRLKTLHNKHPQRTDILAQIGVTEGKLGNFDEALKVFGIAAASEPTNAIHLYNMATILDRKGDKAQAIKYYEKALEVDSIYGNGSSLPRDEIYSRLAKIR